MCLWSSFRPVKSEYGAQRAAVVIMWIINWNATSGHPVTAGHRMTGPGTCSFCTHRWTRLLTRTNTHPDNGVPSRESGWGNFSSGIFLYHHFDHIDSLLFILRNNVASAGTASRKLSTRKYLFLVSFFARTVREIGNINLKALISRIREHKRDIFDRVSLSSVNACYKIAVFSREDFCDGRVS